MTQKKVVNDFVLDQIIGTGAFSDVYKGFNKNNRADQVAIKAFNKDKYESANAQARLMAELQIMCVLDSPYCVKLIDVFPTKSGNVYCIMEYCRGGTLNDAIKRFGTLPEHIVKKFLLQILEALEELQRCNILHRDIKPDNILLTDVNLELADVKLADFGLSKDLGQ
jgi:calcium/calmodulin-dependent protein kinase I